MGPLHNKDYHCYSVFFFIQILVTLLSNTLICVDVFPLMLDVDIAKLK